MHVCVHTYVCGCTYVFVFATAHACVCLCVHVEATGQHQLSLLLSTLLLDAGPLIEVRTN